VKLLKFNNIREEIKDIFSDEVINLFKKYDCIIAGGFIRDLVLDEDPKDIDIFLYNRTNFKNLTNFLENFDFKAGKKFLSENNENMEVVKYTYQDYDIDVIYLPLSDKKHIIESFDFTINMIYYDFKKDDIKISPNYDVVKAIIRKELIPNTGMIIISNVENIIKRYQKFLDKGYTISEGDFDDFKVILSFLLKMQKKEGED
jgi:hypothetical protein